MGLLYCELARQCAVELMGVWVGKVTSEQDGGIERYGVVSRCGGERASWRVDGIYGYVDSMTNRNICCGDRIKYWLI